MYKALELPFDKSQIANEHKDAYYSKKSLELKTHLFPLFKGDVSFLGVYRECNLITKQEVKPSKGNWIQRKLGFIKEAPQLNESIIEQLESSNMLNYNQHASYSDFLMANIEESSKRCFDKIIQLYPRNCSSMSKYLNSKTEIYTFQSSRQLILSMGGMNLLKPLINTVLQFTDSSLEEVHEELFEVADAIGEYSSSLYRHFILYLGKTNKLYLKDGISINRKMLNRLSLLNQIDLLSTISRINTINPLKSYDSKKTISLESSSHSYNDDSADGGTLEKEIRNCIMDYGDETDRISETIDLDFYNSFQK